MSVTLSVRAVRDALVRHCEPGAGEPSTPVLGRLGLVFWICRDCVPILQELSPFLLRRR